MIHHLADVRGGFEVKADAVVVGSGAGGAVAAANLARAGLDTVVLEAGPQVRAADMTRDAPLFMARYFWEGGLRMIGGSAQVPSMAGRCLGGSTVVNSAIMLPLPDWVRAEWARDDGLDWLLDPALDAAYERVFRDTGTTPTPMAVMGRRNLLVRDALEAIGIRGGPLPRAVVDCKGCGDCLTGCFEGRKQSVDRSHLPRALADGATAYTCAVAERILTEGTRAVGVEGSVVDPDGRRKLARFTVRAPRVFVAAGALNTPALLLSSRITANRTVGRTFFAHIGAAVTGFMDEPVDPWFGASQGYGAISERVKGLKYECLWGPPSLLTVRWGGLGRDFIARLDDLRHATIIALVYRAKVRGRVTRGRDGTPRGRLWVPRHEVQTVLHELKHVADGLLKIGARYVNTAIHGAPEEMRSEADTEVLLNPKLGHKEAPMTFNHVFGSCRMSADPKRGTVDAEGKVRGLEGLYLCDASIFPSPSAVNPQATIMALSDVISRRAAELPAGGARASRPLLIDASGAAGGRPNRATGRPRRRRR